jgi:hypothetical protein
VKKVTGQLPEFPRHPRFAATPRFSNPKNQNETSAQNQWQQSKINTAADKNTIQGDHHGTQESK